MRIDEVKKLIFILSVIGIMIASYSFYDHQRPLGKGGCNISETISCDIVNKGPYSEIFGIPQAVFGMAFYIFLASISYILAFREGERKDLERLLVYGSLFGMIYSLSLGAFVYYKLHAVCPICVSSYFVIITIFILSLKLKKEKPELV